MPLRGPPSSSSKSAFSAGCFQGLGRGTPHPPRCQRGLASFHTGQVENRAGPARLTRRECSAFPAPMIARGQGRAFGGLRPEDWGIVLPAQPAQLHGQVWPRTLRSWSGKASASAPPPRHRHSRPTFLRSGAGARRPRQTPDPENSTRRGR